MDLDAPNSLISQKKSVKVVPLKLNYQPVTSGFVILKRRLQLLANKKAGKLPPQGFVNENLMPYCPIDTYESC